MRSIARSDGSPGAWLTTRTEGRDGDGDGNGVPRETTKCSSVPRVSSRYVERSNMPTSVRRVLARTRKTFVDIVRISATDLAGFLQFLLRGSVVKLDAFAPAARSEDSRSRSRGTPWATCARSLRRPSSRPSSCAWCETSWPTTSIVTSHSTSSPPVIGVSRWHFSRAFKAATGLSPRRYSRSAASTKRRGSWRIPECRSPTSPSPSDSRAAANSPAHSDGVVGSARHASVRASA